MALMGIQETVISPDKMFSNLPVVTTEDGGTLVARPETNYQLPENVQTYSFHTRNGVPIRLYVAPAKNERLVIMGGSGLKQDFIRSPEDIRELNNAGITTSWFVIPNPVRNLGFMDYFHEATQEVIINPRHPEVRKLCARAVPKIFMGLSTGAQLFLASAKDEEKVNKLNAVFSGAVLESLFIKPPDTENPVSPASLAFQAFAHWHKSDLPSETFMGNTFLDKTERSERSLGDAELVEPAFGQTLELMSGGKEVRQEVRSPNSNIHKLNFPILLAAGENDGFSSQIEQAGIAKNLKAAFRLYKGKEHSPLTGNMPDVIEVMEVMATGDPQAFEAFKEANGLDNYNVKRPPFPLTRLASRAVGKLATNATTHLVNRASSVAQSATSSITLPALRR
jgi:hypothetical protein